MIHGMPPMNISNVVDGCHSGSIVYGSILFSVLTFLINYANYEIPTQFNINTSKHFIIQFYFSKYTYMHTGISWITYFIFKILTIHWLEC